MSPAAREGDTYLAKQASGLGRSLASSDGKAKLPRCCRQLCKGRENPDLGVKQQGKRCRPCGCFERCRLAGWCDAGAEPGLGRVLLRVDVV